MFRYRARSWISLDTFLGSLRSTRTVYFARQCNTITHTRNFTAQSWATLWYARILRDSMKYLSAVWDIVEAIRRTKAFLINLSFRRWYQNSALLAERKECEGKESKRVSLRRVSKSSLALVSLSSSFYRYCPSNPNGAAACSTWSRSLDPSRSSKIYKFPGSSLCNCTFLFLSFSLSRFS